jgi:hypothetical protein
MINKNIFNLKNKYLYKRIYQQYEFFVYVCLSFFVPFFIGHPQLVIGSLVNFFLIRTAQYYDIKYVLTICVLPSIGVFFAGTIFGVNSPFLIYYLPFIWFSNLTYIYVYKKQIFLKKNNKFFASIKASLIKTSILLGVTTTFVFIFGFPKMFFIAMGALQLITAVIGSFGSNIVYSLENKKVNKI